MCGIVGIFGPNAAYHESLLEKMHNVLEHRGPDDLGVFFSDHVALAHRRLSILDLSEAGKNPMFSPDGRFMIVYNGEVFNFKELKQEIGDRYVFRSQTDTEVVLASYLTWGKHCVEKFIGMFAFAIWDKQEKVGFCARDRFGIKPFYYLIYQEHFYFASEIKALLLTGVQRRVNLETLYTYLKWGIYNHNEETFFSSIKQLKPGHILVWKNGNYHMESYWRISHESEEKEHSNDEILTLLYQSVSLSLRSDVPVGVNISGGLDSSALMALLGSRLGSQKSLEGFFIDYHDLRFSERPWVVEIKKRTHRQINLSLMTPKNFIDCQETMLWFQDEPYGGLPVVSYAGLYQNANKRGVCVLLDGNGLDEIFSGYRKYHNLFLKSLIKSNDPELDCYLNGYAKEWQTSNVDIVEQIQKSETLTSAMDGTQSVQDWLHPEFEAKYSVGFPEFEKPFNSILKNAMFQDLRYTKIPRALRFNDRISMAYSCELRVPFLDHRLVELAFSLPEKSLFKGYRPKGILRQSLANLLPANVLLASKRHLQTPQSEWFSRDLSAYLGDILHSSAFKQRGIIDADKAISIFNSLRGHHIENSFFFWQAINLEHWFQMFIDTSAPPVRPGAFPEFEKETLNFNNDM